MTVSRRFWAYGTGYNGGAVIQRFPEGAPRQFAFFEGRLLAGEFPFGMEVRFSEEFKKEIKIFDSMAVALSIPIVSRRIKEILERLAPTQCEFLPVVVSDHKKKPASHEHFVLNPLRIADIIDMGRSRYIASSFNPDQIGDLSELRLRPDAVGREIHIFRAKTMLKQVFIAESLYEAFQQAKVTGLRLFEAEGWNGDTM
jgi:hypothetical protein